MQKPDAICWYAHFLQTHQVCVFYHAYNKWKCLLAHISWCKIVMKHFESFVSVILLNKKKRLFLTMHHTAALCILSTSLLYCGIFSVQITYFSACILKIIRNASVTSIDMLRQKVCNGKGLHFTASLGNGIKKSIRKNHFSVTLKMLN